MIRIVQGRLGRGVGAMRNLHSAAAKICHTSIAERVLGSHFKGRWVSKSPEIFFIADFLSGTECQKLQRLASGEGLQRSRTVSPEGPLSGEEALYSAYTMAEEAPHQYAVDEARTSSSVAPHRQETLWLTEKAAGLLGLPVEHAETPQIARYQRGEFYHPHYDALDPATEAGRQEMKHAGQRVSTLLIYLNDVPRQQGGGTLFPSLPGSPQVHPRQGAALLFFPADGQGKVDRRLLHGSKSLERGEKWVAQIWMRQFPWHR